jgi:acetyl-CoA acyltransferase 1
MASAKGLKSILAKSPTDVVILSSLRTPVTRAKKGGFRSSYPEELLYHVLRATLAANPTLDPAHIDDVGIGSVLQGLGGMKAGRTAQLYAGFDPRTSFYTIHRQCSSGLQAVTSVGQSIRDGMIDVGIGGGMESMTRNYGSLAKPTVLWPKLVDAGDEGVKDARDCMMSMGVTSENVAKRYGVSRADQDKFAANSHQKASRAQKGGLFDSEIVPVKTLRADDEGKDREIVVDKDDGIRHNATAESMAKLKPVFAEDGASTAGNSSQISDGAAATLLMRRSTATELGLGNNIIGKWVATRVAGCHPDEMGVGPAVAIPKLLDATGVSVGEVGIWEINEAFASQALYCIRKLGIDESRVNPKGGAIARGHPLGKSSTLSSAGPEKDLLTRTRQVLLELYSSPRFYRN